MSDPGIDLAQLEKLMQLYRRVDRQRHVRHPEPAPLETPDQAAPSGSRADTRRARTNGKGVLRAEAGRPKSRTPSRKKAPTLGSLLGGAFAGVTTFLGNAARVVTHPRESLEAAVKQVQDVGAKAWDAIKDAGKVAGDLWDAHGSYLVMASSIACMVIPGMQVVTLGLAALQAFDGARLVVDGIKTGDLKKAMTGLASVSGAAAGGLGALGAKAVGSTAMALARTAGEVSKVAKGVVATASAIETGNWGALAGSAAGLLGAGAEALGTTADQVVLKASAMAQTAATYAKRSELAWTAFTNGDLLGGIAVTAALGSTANTEFGGDQKVSDTLAMAADYAKGARDVSGALRSGDHASAALQLAMNTGILPASTVQKARTFAESCRRLNQSLQAKDFGRAAALAGEIAKDAGLINQEQIDQAQALPALANQLQQTIAGGELSRAMTQLTALMKQARDFNVSSGDRARGVLAMGSGLLASMDSANAMIALEKAAELTLETQGVYRDALAKASEFERQATRLQHALQSRDSAQGMAIVQRWILSSTRSETARQSLASETDPTQRARPSR